MNNTVTCVLVSTERRADHVERLFGEAYPLLLEPCVFQTASDLSADYRGGYWELQELGNGGFYMAPDADAPFRVACPNGHTGELSADAFGVTVCLYAYSRLAFVDDDRIAAVYARQYQLLREYAVGHTEVAGILAATD